MNISLQWIFHLTFVITVYGFCTLSFLVDSYGVSSGTYACFSHCFRFLVSHSSLFFLFYKLIHQYTWQPGVIPSELFCPSLSKFHVPSLRFLWQLSPPLVWSPFFLSLISNFFYLSSFGLFFGLSFFPRENVKLYYIPTWAHFLKYSSLPLFHSYPCIKFKTHSHSRTHKKPTSLWFQW